MTTGVTAVIQARLGSRRLPGKVLADLAGRPVLAWVISACRAATSVDETVITAPIGDDALVAAAGHLGATVILGPEHDLIARYQAAATHGRPYAIVRVTADCPLLDPRVIDLCVAEFLDKPVDYQEARGYPRCVGDADVIRTKTLLAIDSSTASPYEQEHVGPWFLNPDHRCEIRVHEAASPLRRPDLRVCIDEDADLTVVRQVVDRLGDGPLHAVDVIEVLDADDDLRRLNAHVRQQS